MNWYLLLVFLCTFFVYTIHYLRKTKKDKTDDRMKWCREHIPLLKSLLAVSFIFIIGGLLFHFDDIFNYHQGFNLKNLLIIFFIPILAFGYSIPLIPGSKKSLREIGWLKAALLSFTWAFTTVVLPVMMQQDASDFYTKHMHLPILFANRFCFILAICFLFNINDIADDEKDGIKTLASIWGKKNSLVIGAWSMFILNTISALSLLIGFELSGWQYYTVVFIPVILLLLLFLNFNPSFNNAKFVLKHDGLMLFKSMLLIFALLYLS